MIQQGNIHRGRRFAKLPGELNVRGAGRWIPRRVVVCADDRRGRFTDRGPEDLARVGEGARRRPRRYLHPLQESVLSVEAQDPELLNLEPGGERLQVGGDQLGPREEGSLAARLAQGPWAARTETIGDL